MKSSIKFEGLDDLLKDLSKRPAEIKQEAGAIVQNTALRVETRAKSLAPVDTGYLKQHIQAESTSVLSAEVRATANYAIYQEYGTRKMAAQPFMQPAMKQETPLFKQKLTNLVNGGLR